MERERSTIPDGLTMRDAVVLLDAPHRETPDFLETSHVPFAGVCVLVVPVTLIGAAAYAIWGVIEVVAYLPLP